MTGAAFRLVFVTGCTGYVVGLIVLADWAGTAVAVIAGVVGVTAAVVLSEDWEPAPETKGEPEPRRRRHRRRLPWTSRRPRVWGDEGTGGV